MVIFCDSEKLKKIFQWTSTSHATVSITWTPFTLVISICCHFWTLARFADRKFQYTGKYIDITNVFDEKLRYEISDVESKSIDTLNKISYRIAHPYFFIKHKLFRNWWRHSKLTCWFSRFCILASSFKLNSMITPFSYS